MANEKDKSLQNPSAEGKVPSADYKSGQNTGAAFAPKKEAFSEDGGQNSMKLVSPSDINRSLLDQAKDTAGQAYNSAAEKATSKIAEQKSSLSSGLTSVADSVRKVGENLKGSDSEGGIAKYTAEYSDAAAQKIEQAANYFERKDIKEMYRDVENFARSNPAIFVGGAFALGILAARFLKSSSPKHLTDGAGQTFGSDQSAKGAYSNGETRSATNQPIY